MRSTILVLIAMSLTITILLGAAPIAQAQQATPPADPEQKIPQPGHGLEGLWKEIDCECDCDCCTRIKQLIKKRLKNPTGRPMLAPDKRKGETGAQGMRESRGKSHHHRRAQTLKQRGARGEHRMRAERAKRMRRNAKRLDLTDDQREQFADMSYSFRRDMIELDAQLKLQRLELKRLMHGGDASEKELRAAVDAMARARADVEFLKLKTKLDKRRLLTDKQRRKMKSR